LARFGYNLPGQRRWRLKVVSVVGARPQFIKAAVVSRTLRRQHQEVLLHTGQHYDYEMSELFFRELGIPQPDVNLGVGSGSHAQQTAQMLIGIERVLLQERPDWVLIYGDTNSTLAGALAAAKLGLPLAHVEAGLRSFNRAMPEEINRVVADHLSDLLFCPTRTAVENLAHEGITRGVHWVGDVMYDALLACLPVAEQTSDILNRLELEPAGYLLATVHRAGNTDVRENLAAILEGLGATRETVILPLHPRTRRALASWGIAPSENVRLIDPVGYLDMLILEQNARLILTDSGGVQKEAYWLGIPCLTLREETEWLETVEAGWNLLVGTSVERLVEAVRTFRPQGERPACFGDGHAGEKIVQILETRPDPPISSS
ncbi:MAG: non-hydrolyzing UDP-N-acetylglucosamine 2-epimerase, partial [Chloroflexia bacterium]